MNIYCAYYRLLLCNLGRPGLRVALGQLKPRCGGQPYRLAGEVALSRFVFRSSQQHKQRPKQAETTGVATTTLRRTRTEDI